MNAPATFAKDQIKSIAPRRGSVSGMIAAYKARQARPSHSAPGLERILHVVSDYILHAMVYGTYERGEPAFEFGDETTVWVDGWPAGEWITRAELFHNSPGDDIVALRIFDPGIRESINWFIHTADRLAYNAELEARRKSVSSTQIEKQSVEDPLAAHLRTKGHDVRQQVKCRAGRIDIHDVTSGAIIECKAYGGCSDIVAAVNQLRRYLTVFNDAHPVVAVPYIYEEAEWLADLIRQSGIRIIEVEQGFDN